MRIYFAPLEGITGFACRNTHHSFFAGDVDKYFAPFAAPNYTHHFKTREREDIEPANNPGIPLVPQILTNRAEDFLWAANEMAEMGYREINLNLGCPMPTVVKKGRGSGQLRDLDALDRFLEAVCEGLGIHSASAPQGQTGLEEQAAPGETVLPREAALPRETVLPLETVLPRETVLPQEAPGAAGSLRKSAPGGISLSVKTRIGLENADRAQDLVKIYNRYPISELTVHPRTQRDLYGGSPDLEVFSMFLEESVHPVVYNGDIFSVSDYQKICARFPACGAVMIGRGLIKNPALARQIRGGEPLGRDELRAYHDAVFTALQSTLPGDRVLIGKMKELWFYMGENFEGADRFLKEIRKSRSIVQYRAAVRTLFVQCGLLPQTGDGS